MAARLTGARGDGEPIIRRILTNSGWLLAANALTGLLSVGQSVLVTRALGVRSYGVFAVIITFVTVTNRLTSFRMNEFVVKYVSDAMAADDRRQAAAAIKLAVLVEASASLLAFLVVVALAPLAAEKLVKEPGTAELVAAAGLIALATIVAETSLGVLQVFNQFRLQSMLSVGGAFLVFVAVATAFLLGGRLDGMIWAVVAGTFGSSGLVAAAAARTVSRTCGRGWWRAPLGALATRWRAALRFAFSTNASATLSLVTRDADVLWLNLIRNPVEVGYYRLAFTLASYFVLPVAQLGQTFYPEIARQAAQLQWTEFRRLIRWGTSTAAAYLVPVGGVAAVASGWLIHTVYGPEFGPSAGAFVVLIVGMGYANLLFWSRPALLALGRADYPLKVNIGVAGIKLIGIFTIIPAFGYIGNAALLTGLYLAGVTLSVWKVREELIRKTAAAPHERDTRLQVDE